MAVVLDDFVSVVSDLFSSETNVNAQTRFRDLEEWSSMQALILIAAVDEHFGVTLPEKEFRSAVNVQDLFNLTNTLQENA